MHCTVTEMRRFTLTAAFTLALLLLFLSCAVADTAVSDSTGHGLLLPSTSGSATSYINVLSSQVPTSPYHFYVALNADNSRTQVESFFITTAVPQDGSEQVRFGNATLFSQQFSASLTNDAGVSGSYLRNESNPNSDHGTYTFVFTIPVLSTLTFNLTYVNTPTNSPSTQEYVQMSIFNPVSGIVGDPQFVGLRGQQYQVHGIDGAVYNIISEENTQVNSRFVFLTEGDCPVVDGVKDTNCWSHPGSYLGEMGFQAVVDGTVHRVLVSAGSAKRGFASVQMNYKPLLVGDKVQYGDFSLHLQSTHTVTVTTDSFEFRLSNSDLFINQAIKLRVPISQLQAHGLIGQTRSTRTYPTSLRYIEGDVDDYVVADSDIFGADFAYNRFLA